MKTFAVHICLVSQQPLPNFLPIVENAFRPQKVILLVTPEMKKQADFLTNHIKKRCQIKDIEQISIADEYNMSLIEQELLDLLIDYQPDEVAVNITGGTKLMAIAAFNFAQENNYQCIYFTQNQSKIILYHPQRQPETLLKCQNQYLKIEDYLNLHGYEIQSSTQHIKKNLIQPWYIAIEQHDLYAKIIPSLNHQLYKQAESDNSSLPLNELNKNILPLLKDLGEVSGGHFQFHNKDNKQLANGGWFEYFVFEKINEIKKEYQKIQDIQLNIQFKTQADKTYNEVDVAVLCNNVLYLIECKTINFAKDLGQAKGNDILYKLESLKKVGGLNTRCALISYISTQNKKGNNPIKERAKSNQIELWAGKDDIKGLKTHLIKWFKLLENQ